jgi:hypothetical protein
MRRVPVDEEFGTPIAAIRNLPIVLFENGTIAKINESRDDQNPLVFKHYTFYYDNVSQISHLKLNSKDDVSIMLAILMGYKFKIAFTLVLTVILGLSYHFSVDFPKWPLFESDLRFQILAFLLVGGFVAGFEHIIYDYNSKNKFQTRSLQLHLVHRIEPKIILEKGTNNWIKLFEMHNGLTRFGIVLSLIFMPENKDFNTDILQFVMVLFVSNLLIYCIVFSFLPMLAVEYFSKRVEQRDFKKIKEIGFDEFYLLADETIDSSRSHNDYTDKKTLSELISGDENHMLEFKGSVWTAYNPRTYELIETQTKKRDDLQDAIVKSVAGFLNTDGGTLLIGIKDKPHLQEEPIIGIENDFKWAPKKDLEGFGHALIQLLNDAFGDQSTLKLYIEISYPTTNGKTICRIDIKPLPRIRNGELWVKTKTLGEEEFFYRVSDTTTHASAKSALRYIRHHFEGFSEVTEETTD